jgi:hypothetical protein
LEPRADGLDVRVGRSELLAELLRSEPGMEIRGGLILLIGNQLLDGSFLLGIMLEHEQHAVHGQASRRFAAIESSIRQRVRVAFEHNEIVFVNGLSDSRLHAGRLRESETREADEKCDDN